MIVNLLSSWIACGPINDALMPSTPSSLSDVKLSIPPIVTNGGVASTVRDAHVRDFHTITLEDGCAAFSKDTHNLAIQSLKTVGEVMKVADAISLINGN